MELAVLSAMAHGNGPEGLAVVTAAFTALTELTGLDRLDREHAAVYFQIIWDMLREPMQRALQELVMERQVEGKVTYPPFVQQIFEQGVLEGVEKGKLDGLREGRLDGLREGKRETLLRLLARAGIALSEDDRARILGCTDAGTLDRWVENVLGARSAGEVLS
jgi:hypothetical protein